MLAESNHEAELKKILHPPADRVKRVMSAER